MKVHIWMFAVVLGVGCARQDQDLTVTPLIQSECGVRVCTAFAWAPDIDVPVVGVTVPSQPCAEVDIRRQALDFAYPSEGLASLLRPHRKEGCTDGLVNAYLEIDSITNVESPLSTYATVLTFDGEAWFTFEKATLSSDLWPILMWSQTRHGPISEETCANDLFWYIMAFELDYDAAEAMDVCKDPAPAGPLHALAADALTRRGLVPKPITADRVSVVLVRP